MARLDPQVDLGLLEEGCENVGLEWDAEAVRLAAELYAARQVDVFAVLAGVLRRLRIVFILLILSTRTVAIAVLLQVLLELLVCHLLILRVLQKLMAHTIAGEEHVLF